MKNIFDIIGIYRFKPHTICILIIRLYVILIILIYFVNLYFMFTNLFLFLSTLF